MGQFSLANLFGVTIRESANDGSDFTNPDADYRRLFLGEDGQLHVKDSAGAVTDIGGTSSLGWNLDVNQDGTSFAAWAANTSDGGSWSSNGTEIIQTSTSATTRRAKLSAQTPVGWPTILQCECQVVSSSGGVNRMAIGLSDGTSGGYGLFATLDTGGDIVVGQLDGRANFSSYAITLAETTWYTLRVVLNSYWMSLYVDGVFKGNSIMNIGTFAAPEASIVNTNYLTLMTYGASVKFRNIKVWSLSTGAP